MEFLLLGPLEVRHDGVPLMLGPRRAQRCLLGLLLLEAGRMVAADRLADLLWDDDPPDNARAILQTHVSRLRSVLDPHRDGSHGVRLIGQGIGYDLQADPDKIDASRFRSLVSKAESMGDPATRASALRDALRLWRGPILADVATDRLRDRVGAGLAELQLHAWENCMEAELDSGRHREVIAELTDLVSAHPLRERLVHALMVALHRDGRRLDAIDVFQAARERIVEFTGLEPGPDLLKIRDLVLRHGGSAGTTEASTPKRSRQLPADLAHFVGRQAELEEIIRLGSGARDHPLIAAIYGTGGSGKSALAIRAAHRLADRFPDGQLYVDLQGSTPGIPVVPPHDALERMLRALGVSGHDIPVDQAEAASLFRETSAGRHLLIVLDNAKDAVQVKPLIPSGQGCFVIVTSRLQLSTLDHAHRLKIHTLAHDEALSLLGHFDRRVLSAGHSRTATTIVRRCGYLPLALRIAGARLVVHPEWTLAQVAQRLSHGSLDELEQDDLSIRANIAISHDDLATDPSDGLTASLFERIGVFNCYHITPPVAAALAQSSLGAASDALRRLAEHQLLQPMGDDRYGLHDLVRHYAGERGRALSPQARSASIGAVLDHYVGMAVRAAHALFPGHAELPPPPASPQGQAAVDDAKDAQEWLEHELANIMVAARHGVTMAPSSVVELTRALRYPLHEMLCRWTELHELSGLTIAAAQRSGDTSALALGHDTISLTLNTLGDLGTSLTHAKQALALFREHSDWFGECNALFRMHLVHRTMSNYAEAASCLKESAELAHAHAASRLEANQLDNLGSVYSRMSRHDEAIACHLRGLRIREEVGHRLGIAASNENLAWTLLRAGDPLAAARRFRAAIAVSEEVGYDTLRAGALWGLGNAEHEQGNPQAARESWRASIEVFLDLGAITTDEAAHVLSQSAPEMPKALRKLHI